jgi:hypothetical protein
VCAYLDFTSRRAVRKLEFLSGGAIDSDERFINVLWIILARLRENVHVAIPPRNSIERCVKFLVRLEHVVQRFRR